MKTKLMIAAIAVALSVAIAPPAADAGATQDAYYVCMVGNAALLLKSQEYVLKEEDTAFYKTIRRKCEKLHPKMTETEEEGLSEEFEMALTALATIGGGDKAEAQPKNPFSVPMAPDEKEE